jgi:mercuric ion transport protein
LILLGLFSCCLMPLILSVVGIAGAWISNLPFMQAYRPWLLLTAVTVMFLVWRHVYRQPLACKPGDSCALPQSRLGQKIVFWVAAAALFNVLGYPYVAKYFY